MTVDKLALGLQRHQEGQPQEAERLYRAVLREDPYNSDAWHLLGMIKQLSGDFSVAIDCIQRAISLSPDFADYHNNLATVHSASGDFTAAEASCREAIRLRPTFAQAHNNLGNALAGLLQFNEAVESYRRAVELQPAYPLAWANAGNAWRQLGDFNQAVTACERALQFDPQCVEALNNLANVQLDRGQFQQAVECFGRARALRPSQPEVINNLGVALQKLDRWEEAIRCHHDAIALRAEYLPSYIYLAAALRRLGQFEQTEEVLRRALSLAPQDAWIHHDLGELLWRRKDVQGAENHFRKALELEPTLATGHFNLANVLRDSARLDEAEHSYRLALANDPESVSAVTNLAITLSDQGRTGEALELFEQAHRLAPDDPRAHSHLLVCRQYLPGVSLATLATDHSAWGRQHAQRSFFEAGEFCVTQQPERRLRIGFVSRDFRLHPVAFLILSTLEKLDQQQFEVLCYSDHKQSDEMTERIRRVSGLWREVSDLSDDQFAETIRSDHIDILVDLAGHTAGNRLLVFARKPAPVQITWLGYVGTTGLEEIDYLLSDRFHTLPEDEQYYSEQIVRLPDSYACYSPPTDAPPVASLPALANGYVTFGCFNNPVKLTDETLTRWSQILRRVANSRLLLKYSGFDSSHARAALHQRFASVNLDAARVTLQGYAPNRELLQQYGAVDVALDTLPYAGGVTTCEALWMGVPVVAQPGNTFAGRHSLSYLTSAGLIETIAATSQEYLELAVTLASDLDRLAELRSKLRTRVARSPLCDAQRFATGFEAALRAVWRQHCDGSR